MIFFISINQWHKFIWGLVIISFYTFPGISAQISFQVNFREAAAIFDLMDNVSLWQTDGFCRPEYRTYWNEHFPLALKDNELFEKYKVIRSKYYRGNHESDPLKAADGLFMQAESMNEDPLADAFYASSTLEEAFVRLKGVIEPAEIEFLKEFYKNFEPHYLALIKDCKRFAPLIQTERNKLTSPEILSYLEEVAAFYQVKEEIIFNVLHTWFPSVTHSTAGVSGNHLVLRFNPSFPDLQDESNIVLHEVIHAISRLQSRSQKQTLTKTFLANAPSKLPEDKYHIIEEPLAVVLGQMLYLEQFDPKEYKKYESQNNWYMDGWITEYAKLIYPHIKEALQKQETLDETLIKKLASLAVHVTPR